MDEKDADGKGIRVKANYWMEIINRRTMNSKQREQQENIDKPNIVYYAAEYEPVEQKREFKAEALQSQSPYLKTLVYPIDQNEIQLRVANLHDYFDGHETPIEFDVKTFAINYYYTAYRTWRTVDEINLEALSIEERTISGTQEYKRGTAFTHEYEWNHERMVSLKRLRLESEGVEVPEETGEEDLVKAPADPDLKAGQIVLEP